MLYFVSKNVLIERWCFDKKMNVFTSNYMTDVSHCRRQWIGILICCENVEGYLRISNCVLN